MLILLSKMTILKNIHLELSTTMYISNISLPRGLQVALTNEVYLQPFA